MTDRPDDAPRTWWAPGQDPWSTPAELPSHGGQPYAAGEPVQHVDASTANADTTVIGAPPSMWSGSWETTTGAPAPKPARQVGMGVVAGVAAVSALLAGVVGGVVGARLDGGGSVTNSSASLGTTNGTVVERAPGSIAAIAGKVAPSVVSIKVSSSEGSGTGSGWVVDGDGYLVTNNHVIASAAQEGTITVNFTDGTSEPGRIVGRAPTLDIAVLKVADLHGAKALPLGDSDKIAVGDPVIAIGSPLGLAGTVTSGIVSAVHRAVDTGGASGDPGAALDAVQTDAAINPGNSGGPLVDAAGRVIGVNSAIASLGSSLGGQSGSIGVGFAIPINTVKAAGEQIIRTGKATRPILGVQLVREANVEGALIGCDQAAVCTPVQPGGPAAKGGLADGDVIVKLGNTVIDSATTLILELRRHKIGEAVDVVVKRNGRQLTKTVVLGTGDA